MSKTCLICNIKDEYPICRQCSNDPYNVEKARVILSEARNYYDLKILYDSKYKQIQNKNTSKFWNSKFSEQYSFENQDGMTKDRIKEIIKLIPNGTNKLLDVGFGYGFLEEQINKRKNIELYGFDISKEAVKKIKRKVDGEFIVGDIYSIPYKSNSFDVVVTLEVLEHIAPDKVLTVLFDLRKILKSKGTLIIAVPTNENLKLLPNNPNGHLREYTNALITAELKISGFKVKRIINLSAHKNFYLVKKILSKSVLKRRWKANDIIVQAVKL